MIRVLPLAVLLFLTGCGGSSGESSSSSNQNACGLIGLNTKIINGATCDDPRRSAVVRFVTLDSNGEVSGFCSGTLITPSVVLTATHCFLGEIAGIIVVAGEPGRSETVAGRSYSVSPGFSLGGAPGDERLFNDAAIIRLSRSLSSPVMPILLSRAPQVGEPGYVYGFGVTQVGGNQPSVDELKAGSMIVRSVTPNHLFVRFDGGVNVCNGDSGGPLVVQVNGQPAQSGITSQGNRVGCQKGDVTTFTNLQSPTVLDWLTKEVPDLGVR